MRVAVVVGEVERPRLVAAQAVRVRFVDDQDQDGYVWIRRFEDEAQSEALYKAVYDHDRWKNEIGPAVYALLIPEKTVVTRVVPTPASPLR